MAAPVTTDKFLEIIRKSRVADEARLTAYLEEQRTGHGLPDEPGRAAGLLVRDGLLTHFQAEQLLQGKWRRFVIGEYKVLERLGSGSSASVYLCEDTATSRCVAVKVVPAATLEEHRDVFGPPMRQYYHAAAVLGAYDHPNVVRVDKVVQEMPLHFLVMEFVDGIDLGHLVEEKGPLPVSQACEYLRQAALTLHHLATCKTTPLRIKPSNLIATADGARVKLTDPGICYLKWSAETRGGSDTANLRHALLFFGVTSYYILTGQALHVKEGFEGQTEIALWEKPQPVDRLRPDVPSQLAEIVWRLLMKPPRDRSPTAVELADELRAYCKEDRSNWVRPGRRLLSPRAMARACGQ